MLQCKHETQENATKEKNVANQKLKKFCSVVRLDIADQGKYWSDIDDLCAPCIASRTSSCRLLREHTLSKPAQAEVEKIKKVIADKIV